LNPVSGQRVLWALDAFEPNLQFCKTAESVLQSIIQLAGGQIEPVYVLNPAHLDLTSESDGIEYLKYRPAAEKALESMVDGFEPREALLKPHVIVQRSSTSTGSVEALLEYADTVAADCIVVSTHGRKGVSRLFLGSFAENLLLKSNIPVLVVNPKIEHLQHSDHWFFPTEFEPRSAEVFRKIVYLAKAFHAKLTLFHSVPHPVESMVQSGVYLLGGGWLPINPYFEANLDHQNRRAAAWCRWAMHQGVQAEPCVQSQIGSLSTAILSLAAQKDAGFIIMEEKVNLVSAAIVGSITRQVIRNSHLPVWVVRHTAKDRQIKGTPESRKAAA